MKKIISVLLAVLVMASLGTAAYADSYKSCTSIGADLNDEQVESVYSAFGITRGSGREIKVTNAEERQYLEGYVNESMIGTRSISCIYLNLTEAGSGMNITTSNITWCTPEMYVGALATAGITDAEIIVAAPFEVSGTAALTGIYKAYEELSGN